MNVSRKIWGIKHRVFENKQTEIDLLYLEKNSACSVHKHKEKINRFFLIKGKVTIKTDLGEKVLSKNESFDVEAGLVHQFIVNEDSILLEMAFVNKSSIDNNDIERLVQGGKFINGKFHTLDNLKKLSEDYEKID